VSQLAFGSVPGLGAGNACGRCFELFGESDPYDTSFTGPFKSIIVKATDMCPVQGNEQWCGQTTQNPVNSFGASMQYVLSPVYKSACSPRFHRSFDLCHDSGAADAFFPSGHGALKGTYKEVSCNKWDGLDSGNPLWNGACLKGENARTWPKLGGGCPNQGTELFLPSPRIFSIFAYCRHRTLNKWGESRPYWKAKRFIGLPALYTQCSVIPRAQTQNM
jgi:hypothetical protein